VPRLALAKIENATALVRTLDDWRRVTTEAIGDASSDGLTAVELRFSPQFIAKVTGLDADDVIDAVSDAAAGTGLPIEVGLIGIIVRDEGPDSATTQIRRLRRWTASGGMHWLPASRTLTPLSAEAGRPASCGPMRIAAGACRHARQARAPSGIEGR
jgi:Adenosine deaminase